MEGPEIIKISIKHMKMKEKNLMETNLVVLVLNREQAVIFIHLLRCKKKTQALLVSKLKEDK